MRPEIPIEASVDSRIKSFSTQLKNAGGWNEIPDELLPFFDAISSPIEVLHAQSGLFSSRDTLYKLGELNFIFLNQHVSGLEKPQNNSFFDVVYCPVDKQQKAIILRDANMGLINEYETGSTCLVISSFYDGSITIDIHNPSQMVFTPPINREEHLQQN